MCGKIFFQIGQYGGQLITFQKTLLVLAVIATVGAMVTMIFGQGELAVYNPLFMLIAVTLGVVGFSSLEHE
jgi:hypothetical protein